MMPIGSAVAGTLLVIVTWWSLLRTLVVPRGSSQLVLAKNRALVGLFRWLAHRTRTYEGRDRVLVWVSPLSIFTSLLAWLALFFIGYALLMYAFSDLDLVASFREAGSSLFTLGFASSDRANLTVLDFVAAATGPITIGLLIGYLPTMYAAYQTREAEVTLLLARAGEPNWGPELIARHAMVGMSRQLDELWPAWERWAAEVAESHTNFPMLIQMRSARPSRNWLVSLLCVMDAAAIELSVNPATPQDRTRLLLRQGIVCLRELATVERIGFDEDPSPDTASDVTEREFAAAYDMLAAVGYPMERSAAESYPHFRGWRANYESLAYALAERIEAVPAPWSGPRRPPLPVIRPHRPVNRMPGPQPD
jgi:hypothetical protein